MKLNGPEKKTRGSSDRKGDIDMKCSGCGEDFPNLNVLTRHKKVCPAGVTSTGTKKAVKKMKVDMPPWEQIIPSSLLPEEIKYYSYGQTVSVVVEGTYTGEGLTVGEVKLVR